MDRAMEMAHTLAALDYEKMPAWARQMPAFIAQAQGDKRNRAGDHAEYPAE
ncbi:MAG: hypothetical protein H6867_09510 [Rhodospirillales bacterium]|nr:hypothetical protein [Rhodospirillales bacterium]